MGQFGAEKTPTPAERTAEYERAVGRIDSNTKYLFAEDQMKETDSDRKAIAGSYKLVLKPETAKMVNLGLDLHIAAARMLWEPTEAERTLFRLAGEFKGDAERIKRMKLYTNYASALMGATEGTDDFKRFMAMRDRMVARLMLFEAYRANKITEAQINKLNLDHFEKPYLTEKWLKSVKSKSSKKPSKGASGSSAQPPQGTKRGRRGFFEKTQVAASKKGAKEVAATGAPSVRPSTEQPEAVPPSKKGKSNPTPTPSRSASVPPSSPPRSTTP